MPTREASAQIPRFAHGALVGWASYSRRARPNDPAIEATLDQDSWPREDRDFCPSCAAILEDQWRDIGIVPAENTEKILDALGRPIASREATMGVVACWAAVQATPGQRHPCMLERGHAADVPHSGETSFTHCALCWSYVERNENGLSPQLRERRLYTREQLEHHAVSEHSVEYQDALEGTRTAGWLCTLEEPRVTYANVESALLANLRQTQRPLGLARFAALVR